MYDQFLTGKTITTLSATMPDGTVSDTHWKKCAHVDFEKWRGAESSDNPEKVERAKQSFIAACLVNPDGTRAMTDEQSIQLTAEGVSVLFPLALEASGVMKRPDPKGDTPDSAENT